MTIRRKMTWKRFQRYIPLYLFMMPCVIYLILNNYIPMAGLLLAFKKINYSVGLIKSPWVGFGNFRFLFKTNDAWIIIRNTLGYNAAFIIIGTAMSITVAIILNEIRNKWLQKSYQTMILLPYLLSTVVIAYIVYAFLSSDNGLINKTIRNPLGLSSISWYSSPKYWPFILIIVYLWRSVGYNCIIYFATIVGIDRTLYEAAVIDGASVGQQIRYVTLPCLKPTIITMTLLAVGRIFYSDFGLFYQVPMNNGMLYDVTNTIDTYVYRGLMQFNDVGRSTAAGFVQSIVGFVMVLTANLIVRKVEEDSALF